MNTVQELRKSGYKVLVNHLRYPARVTKNTSKRQSQKIKLENVYALTENGLGISPFGGKTTLDIVSPDGATYHSDAECSVKDVYNKRLGIKIALGRALKQMGIQDTFNVEA